MIKSNELRIGNSVMFSEDGENCIVTEITQGGLEVLFKSGEQVWIELEKFSPIELTPEILRNSGFASSFTSDPQEPNASKVFELNEFKVHQQNENINEFEVYNFITHERIMVTGVHHLQNLYYFAFDTHQELNINL